MTTIGANNYTIPAGCKNLEIIMVGGAGGGGSGRRGAAGTVRCGGATGACGAVVRLVLNVSSIMADFPTGIVPCWVGFGGAGGAAVTTDNTNGNAGQNGDYTWFGGMSYILATLGGGGGGGTATGATAGGALQGGTEVQILGLAPRSTCGVAPSGGFGKSGTGGGITSGDVANNGGFGAGGPYIAGVAGVAGVVDTSLPTSGSPAHVWLGIGAPPGGGAASKTQAA